MTAPQSGGPESLRDRALGPLLLLAALVRVLSATSSPLINADAYYYHEVAALFRSGNILGALETECHPLYPALLAAVKVAIPDTHVAGAGLSILASLGALVALYGLALDGWGRWPARFTAFLFAVHPALVDMEGKVMTEGLYHLLAISAALLFWRGLRYGSWRWGAAGGICLGGAYLTRAEGVVLGALLFGSGGLVWLARRFPGAWRGVLGCLVFAVAVASPYLIWLRGEYGRWLFSPRLAVARAVESERPEDIRGSQYDVEIRRRYGPVLASVINTLRQEIKAYHTIPLILAALAVLFFRRGLSGGPMGLFLLLVAGANLAILMLFYYRSLTPISTRYVSFAAAILLPWAGWGLYRSAVWLVSEGRPALCGAGLLILVSGASVARPLGFDRRDRRAAWEAAVWVRDRGGAGRAIVSTSDAIAFHTGGRHVPAVTGEYVLEQLRKGTADFLVLQEDRMSGISAGDWERIQSFPGVAFLRRFGDPGRGVLVYEVRRPR